MKDIIIESNYSLSKRYNRDMGKVNIKRFMWAIEMIKKAASSDKMKAEIMMKLRGSIQ